MLALMKPVLRCIRVAVTPFKPIFEFLSEIECRMSASWAKAAHKRLMFIQWTLPPNPENFDHHIDLYAQWLEQRNAQWLERGVYSILALKGGNVLELCCGDGFNARNFYSLTSRQVVACDFDKKIIGVANRKNSAPNITYQIADIRTEMPAGKFQNIIWDAAVEHFSPVEIESIMANIKTRLEPDGILSGYTIVEGKCGHKHLPQHEYEFKDKADLVRFLKPHFANVTVFETKYPTRHNLYFWASDSVIPFWCGWEHGISS